MWASGPRAQTIGADAGRTAELEPGAYRDANCESELATYGSGSMGPNMSGFCEIRLARQRIQELKYIYPPEH